MTKSLITSGIRKTFLDLKGVENYYIFWNIEDHVLTLEAVVTVFKSTTYSKLIVKGIDMSDADVVIWQPERLLKLLSIAEDDLKLTINKKYDTKLVIKDNSFEQDFILCDPDIINKQEVIPQMDEPLSYDFVLPLDEPFIDKFLKAKKANGSEIVTVGVKDRKARFELGDDNSYSNKSRFFIEDDGMFDMKELQFSSDVIQNILERNKGCKGTLFVDPGGLMKISFKEKIGSFEPEVNYFLIALDQL